MGATNRLVGLTNNSQRDLYTPSLQFVSLTVAASSCCTSSCQQEGWFHTER